MKATFAVWNSFLCWQAHDLKLVPNPQGLITSSVQDLQLLQIFTNQYKFLQIFTKFTSLFSDDFFHFVCTLHTSISFTKSEDLIGTKSRLSRPLRSTFGKFRGDELDIQKGIRALQVSMYIFKRCMSVFGVWGVWGGGGIYMWDSHVSS